ncbi:PREDICTED: uncharacterized protein LOC108547088 isoform X3 [Eufriesea mexicana]|uniref:uncharacterized protein LOC108547088 isoform X3 n=1 Tax=Eufriesea mexicana TaxID=516756 RepID=UPI00083BB8D8|nr:PREDICTED: uncharacterized protein LOC108547088 isoform X3 [Eufriesea mexicana]
MFMIWGDWFTGGVQSVDTQSLIDSVIITNKSIIRRIRVPTYEMYKTHWRNGEIFLGRTKINKFRSRNTEKILGSIFSSTYWNNFYSCSDSSFNGNILFTLSYEFAVK